MSVGIISSYTDLQDNIAVELNRGSSAATSGIASSIPLFIQLAERAFRRDERFRRIAIDTAFTFTTAGQTVALPADFGQLKAWTHNGPTWYGPIETIGFDRLGEFTRDFGLTGVPQFAAIDDANLLAYMAPVPDDAYETTLAYEMKISPLASAGSNWILSTHPDAYLYGSLIHTAPFLKDDERLPLWKMMYEEIANSVHEDTLRAQFSGTMRRRFRPIGG
jgi:hypothetical protein